MKKRKKERSRFESMSKKASFFMERNPQTAAWPNDWGLQRKSEKVQCRGKHV